MYRYYDFLLKSSYLLNKNQFHLFLAIFCSSKTALLLEFHGRISMWSLVFFFQQFTGLSVMWLWLKMPWWTAGFSYMIDMLTIGMIPVCNKWPLLLTSLTRVHMSTHTAQHRGVLEEWLHPWHNYLQPLLSVFLFLPLLLFILNIKPWSWSSLSLSWHPTQETTHSFLQVILFSF